MTSREIVEPDAVLQALRVVQGPDLGRDIVSLDFVKELRIEGGQVSFEIELTTPACPVKEQMHDHLLFLQQSLKNCSKYKILLLIWLHQTLVSNYSSQI